MGAGWGFGQGSCWGSRLGSLGFGVSELRQLTGSPWYSPWPGKAAVAPPAERWASRPYASLPRPAVGSVGSGKCVCQWKLLVLTWRSIASYSCIARVRETHHGVPQSTRLTHASIGLEGGCRSVAVRSNRFNGLNRSTGLNRRCACRGLDPWCWLLRTWPSVDSPTSFTPPRRCGAVRHWRKRAPVYHDQRHPNGSQPSGSLGTIRYRRRCNTQRPCVRPALVRTRQLHAFQPSAERDAAARDLAQGDTRAWTLAHGVAWGRRLAIRWRARTIDAERQLCGAPPR